MQDLILRWAFGQLFGSKAKKYYDVNIAPVIDKVLTSGHHNPEDVLGVLLQSAPFAANLDKLMTALKINSSFKGIAEMMVTEWITAQVNAKFGKK